MRFHSTIGLAPSPSSAHYKVSSRKTRGPDVAASVSRSSCMRCHGNLKVTRLNSNKESRTNITIRAPNPYIHQMSYIHTYIRTYIHTPQVILIVFGARLINVIVMLQPFMVDICQWMIIIVICINVLVKNDYHYPKLEIKYFSYLRYVPFTLCSCRWICYWIKIT